MSGTYDRIARFYDVDMARNMPFDDVAFYRDVCRRKAGRALELGCGTGRILLGLLAAGVDAIGVDASDGMLQELVRRAREQSLPAPACRMDARALAFRRAFDAILLPYSLVTYITADDDLVRTFAGLRAVLNPGGLLVVDAFIPRTVVGRPEFTLDYRRAFGDHVLARWKRITPLGPRQNRIERRYEVLDAADHVLESFDVAEEIRPFTPDELGALVDTNGFSVDETWWDYTLRTRPAAAQFFTVVAHAR